jgi:hypothetical protein
MQLKRRICYGNVFISQRLRELVLASCGCGDGVFSSNVTGGACCDNKNKILFYNVELLRLKKCSLGSDQGGIKWHPLKSKRIKKLGVPLLRPA